MEDAPEGLNLLHVTGTVPEAEVIRSVLIEAGFNPEFVPGEATGVFGMTGNNHIYVPAEEFTEADVFLKEYLSAPPLEDDFTSEDSNK